MITSASSASVNTVGRSNDALLPDSSREKLHPEAYVEQRVQAQTEAHASPNSNVAELTKDSALVAWVLAWR